MSARAAETSRNVRSVGACERDGWRSRLESWIFGTENSRVGARFGAEGGRRPVRVAPPFEQPAREVSAPAHGYPPAWILHPGPGATRAGRRAVPHGYSAPNVPYLCGHSGVSKLLVSTCLFGGVVLCLRIR